MAILEEYADPPIKPLFFNPLYEEGFELIPEGSNVNLSFSNLTTYDEPTWEYIKETKKSKILNPLTMKAKAREDYRERLQHGGDVLLFLPRGGVKEARNAYFSYVEDEEPLFQRFANLQTDEDILEFSGEYGLLRGKIVADKDFLALESLDFWRREILLVKGFLVVWNAYDQRTSFWAYLKRNSEGNKEILKIPGENGNAIMEFAISANLKEERRESLRRALAGFLDSKVEKCGLSTVHFMDNKKTKSYLKPFNLLGAIWLQLSQSFFKDGPSENMVQRCYLSGLFFPLNCLSQRTKGENKGLFYYPGMKHRLYKQKNYRKKKAQEGKTVKPHRRGRTEFQAEM